MNPADAVSVNNWIGNISKALEKTEDGYFMELTGGENSAISDTLRRLFSTNAIHDEDIQTVNAFKKFLDKHNRNLTDSRTLNPAEKKKMALLNKKGSSLEVGEAITALGGNPYFLRYHGHSNIFEKYFTQLLQGNIVLATEIFEEFRKEHVVGQLLQLYLDSLKKSTNRISKEEFNDLFNGNGVEKKRVKEKYTIPHGLFTVASWIIALGEDPTKNERGETKEMYLMRILTVQGWFN